MIVRDIKTKVVPVTEKVDDKDVPVMKDGQPVTKIVPELDAQGREIELWSVTVPQEVEAKGGPAIDAYVAKHKKSASHHQKPSKES